MAKHGVARQSKARFFMVVRTAAPTILIDTREGEPYAFDQAFPVVRRALKAGDYSLMGMEDRVGVERKEISDFVQTVIHHRQRFAIELKKLREMEASCVLVEACMADLLKGRYRSGAHPHTVFGAVISIIVDCGVPVYFCSDRQIACRFTQEYLLRFWRNHQEAPREKA
jgi:ERCC4-type nuclease